MRVALCESVFRETLAFEEIAIDDELLMTRDRLANGLGMHVGIAVHVAADPGAEAQDLGQFELRALRAVDLLQPAASISS